MNSFKHIVVAGLLVVGMTGVADAQMFGPHRGPGYAPGYGHPVMPGYGMPGHPMMPGYGMPGYQMMQPGYGLQGGPGMGRAAIVDANDDGVISADEAATNAEDVFTAMDTDDDGSLTKEEFMTIRMGPQYGWNQARQIRRQQAKEARFDAMDTDGDGSVSKGDFIGGAQARFAQADKDGDGKVSPWDFRRQRRRW